MSVVPGKVNGSVLNQRLMQGTESKVSEEQKGFRRGRGCVEQIFVFKSVI